jgi:predicted dehydrogenase
MNLTSGEDHMEPIRIIVAGCGGGRGAWFVQQIAQHPDYHLTALVDQLPAAAQAVAEEYALAGIPIYEDTRAALGQVTTDAVLVATPDGQHTAPVLDALSAGKFVYVEKPLALTLEDCLAIVRADRAAGHHTMVGFNLRYAPLYRRAHEMIREGALGRLLTIQADEFYYGGRTYFRRWNRLRRYGGGLWITKASHDFDQLYWLAGTLPLRVSASARLTHYVPKPEAGQRCSACPIEPTCPDSHLRDMQRFSALRLRLQALREANGLPPADLCLYNSDKDTFDHGTVQVEFTGDILANYTLNVVAPFTDRRLRIGGSEATLEGALSANELSYWRRHEADDVQRAQRLPLSTGRIGSHGGGDAFLLDDFAAFVRGQMPQPIGPAEASIAIALGLAATRSSDIEQAVNMQDLALWVDLVAELESGS